MGYTYCCTVLVIGYLALHQSTGFWLFDVVFPPIAKLQNKVANNSTPPVLIGKRFYFLISLLWCDRPIAPCYFSWNSISVLCDCNISWLSCILSPKCISQDRSIFCLELEASSRPFSMVSAGVGVNAKWIQWSWARDIYLIPNGIGWGLDLGEEANPNSA